jgi:hypothetical protein
MEANHNHKRLIDRQPSRKVATLAITAATAALDALIPRQEPIADMIGYLADCQVRRRELFQIADTLRKSWPLVHSLRCGMIANRPRLTVCLEGCTDELRSRHRSLTIWLKSEFPGLSHFSIGYLNPTPWNAWGRDTLIYPEVRLPEVIKLMLPES